MFGIKPADRARSLAMVLAAHGIAAWLVLELAHTSFIRAREAVVDTFDVRPAEPPPPLKPPPAPAIAAPRLQGAAAPARPAVRPVPPPSPAAEATVMPEPSIPAPPPGGLRAEPAGTGGGGTGGTGSGAGGDGAGSGGQRPAVAPRLRGGQIVPRDYPRAAGGAQGTVVAHVGVGADGRVTGCTIARSSGNAVLDMTTCRLIRERFRFTPARNAQGEAVAGDYGWQQRWWRD